MELLLLLKENKWEDIIFSKDFNFKNYSIPETILGHAPFIAEPYFGHRSRIYQLDLYSQPDKIADIIIQAYDEGVRAINLVNDENLIKGFDLACDAGCKMKVIATVGKSNMDYIAPNYEIASEVDWDKDIEFFSNYDCPLMLVDEFIVDGYNWSLTSKILGEINDAGVLSGIITAFPYKTTDKLINNSIDMDLFDFYMIPINSFAYMMDTPSFLKNQREEFREKLLSLNKKIIACRIFAAGILMPDEAFAFLNNLDFIDLITFGVASKNEIIKDMEVLKRF